MGRTNKCCKNQWVALFVSNSLNFNKGIPTIIGEIGIPSDTDNRKCYETGDFSTSISAMNITSSALEKSLLSGILWNYTPDHTIQNGDGWNGEDLHSTSQITHLNDCDLFAGGRALSAVIRQYMMKYMDVLFISIH